MKAEKEEAKWTEGGVTSGSDNNGWKDSEEGKKKIACESNCSDAFGCEKDCMRRDN